MRFVLVTLTLLSLALVVIAAACAASDSASMSGSDADGDTDGDSDSDTGGVPIEYPEAINHFMNPNSLLTGPISPPPEDVFEKDLEPAHDLDSGLPDEEIDEDFGDDEPL
ncbi:MAG: hypothetical protein JRF63_00910 [Deltaproteobacteria bacterium]|nr:hypothetical protein [Deltaproteobacteria bacterium]